MYNLVVDIGNTYNKAAVFSGLEVVDFQRIDGGGTAGLQQLLEKYRIDNSCLSSVSGEAGVWRQLLEERTNFVPFSTAVNPGIINLYKTPLTLGLDRWAKLIAAFRLYPGEHCLIIDCGTCITADLLTKKGEYFGGSIGPGINMRFKALHNYTGKLPLVKWDGSAEIPEGDQTVNAIKHGVLAGYVYEAEGYITRFNEEYTGLKVLVSGGDAGFLCLRLKNSIFAPQITEDPLLVLRGLNEVITIETCT